MTAFKIEFPEDLPVSARRHEIQEALDKHQVIIVCGETGSGKTTQLPKIALAMGRGKCNYPAGTPGGGKLIAHTQPRRIAASSVAKRIAQELNTPLGEVVGFKVRFQDKLSQNASVKLMTDGILLAETQSDPLLQAYDTIIIDEAHERSLNIDFLLGYLKQILPRRPDLKIIVTSATIDADRFAKHFESRKGPAPVIMVSGRMFPVEQRYRPFEERKDYDMNDAIADAVEELWHVPSQAGDILIFFPGEREIREAAEHLRGFLSHHPLMRNTDILPLFARLSQAEQDRVFEHSNQRRIVLATNVAETSLTVPGIRYVIDTGTARVKRYSYRSKVEQLLVEPISQAAARQRAGRCGRVADGICIRLYDEASHLARAEFTDPEILRSSLAAVILRMKSLHLGVVEDFPFIDAPSSRAITDGYQLLQELGAVDEANELTALGQTLARLPLDPRLGRMILAGKESGALAEILVITSALSVQDVRDRPLNAQAQADAAHTPFDDEKSEFIGYVKLWNWLANLRGGGAAAHATPLALGATPTAVHKLSNRQQEQQQRDKFINARRVREWRDIHSQLLTVVNEQKWRLNTIAANYESIHQSLLAGLLGNIGFKSEADAAANKAEYLGARTIKFYPHPGAHLSKKPGRWIMAAELVETTRLFGRGIATIDPVWIERIAGHLLKKQLLDPHWEKKAAQVVAFERATLYGLIVYAGRRVQYNRADPAAAREIFIRSALVEGEWESHLPFVVANKKLIAKVQELEHQSRRQDVLVDDQLIFAFYDQLIPKDVCSGQTLEHWYKTAVKTNPKILQLSKEELMRHEAAGITTDSFPKTVRMGGVDCLATYLHDPGDPKDGVTVAVPLFVLNQVNDDRPDWLVPGMLKEKIIGLIKSLPQKPRARLVPVPESASQMALFLSTPERFAKGSLIDALVQLVKEKTGLEVRRADFKTDMLPAHLLMNIRVLDDTGRQLGAGRQIGALKAQLGQQARGAFAALAQLNVATTATTATPQNANHGQSASGATSSKNADTKAISDGNAATAKNNSHSQLIDAGQKYTQWSFGHLPELLELKKGGQNLIGFPALVDIKDAVMLEVFDEPDAAKLAHLKGLRRLFALQIKDALKYLEKNLPDLQRLGTSYMALGSLEELKSLILDLAIDKAFLQEPLPSSESEFKKRLDEGRSRLTLIANEVARIALGILLEAAAARMKLKDSKIAPDVALDMQAQLQALVGKKFLLDQPYGQLQHFPRYLKAMVMRLDKLKADPARDKLKMLEFKPLEQKFWRLVQERKGQLDPRMQEMRWLLEELRVSLFAQELRTPQPVSVKRLEKVWAQLML